MSDSPWSSQTPSRGAVARPSPNWGFFLLINVGLAIAVGILDYALTSATGVSLPGFAVNLVVLVASTWLAGRQWLSKAGGTWSRQDRGRLAFAYTMVNLAMTVLGLLLIFGVLSAGLGGPILEEAGITEEMLSMGMVVMGVIVAVVVPLVLWACYGIMRLVLGHMVGGTDRTNAADEFS